MPEVFTEFIFNCFNDFSSDLMTSILINSMIVNNESNERQLLDSLHLSCQSSDITSKLNQFMLNSLKIELLEGMFFILIIYKN